jgi:hypothetical protein
MTGDVGTEDGGENNGSIRMSVGVGGSEGGLWDESDMVSYESTDSGLSDIAMKEEKGDGDMCT